MSEKRGRGRPRKEKDPKATIGPNKKSLVHKLERTRSSTKKRNINDSLDEVGPNDGEVRYLLTLKSLPKNLEIIAKSLFPPTKNKFEEHRLVCKVLNEERDTKPREIFIPTFRKLPQNRKGQKIHEKEGKQSSKSEKVNIVIIIFVYFIYYFYYSIGKYWRRRVLPATPSVRASRA